MKKKSVLIAISLLVVFSSFFVMSCSKAYHYPVHYLYESYANWNNTTEITFTHANYSSDEQTLTYAFECYFGTQVDADRFSIQEYWFIIDSTREYYIMGNLVVHTFEEPSITFLVNDEEYNEIETYNFMETQTYTVVMIVDLLQFSQVFGFDVPEDMSLNQYEQKIMIQTDGLRFFIIN